MTVHPVSHAVYLSIARGHGPEASAAVVRVGTDGELSVVDLEDFASTSFTLDDAPSADDERMDVWLDGTEPTSQPREIHGVTLEIAQVPIQRSTVTGLAWVDGSLFVAGLSNEEFSSRLRSIPSPFDGLRHRDVRGNLSRRSRQVRDAVPHPCAHRVRRRVEHPRDLHVHAGRAVPVSDLRGQGPGCADAPSPNSAR